MVLRSELKIGLAGRRACSFIAGFRSIPETRVVALCDINPETLHRLADEHSIPERYLEYDEMIESDLDAVVVGTPMHLHVPQTIAALAKGRHVLSEVTAAVSLEQCRDLVEAVRRSGSTYMMAENACYQRSNMLVANMVRHGLFGDVYYAEGDYVHDCHHLHYDAQGRPTWRTVWQVGKNGCTYGTHALGPVLQWLDDRVATVSCFGSGVHTEPAHQMDDSVTMVCKTSRGALIVIRNDMQSPRPATPTTHFTLQGTKGAYQSARRNGEPNLVWLQGRSPGREEWQSLDEYEAEFLPEAWQTLGERAKAGSHGGSDFFVVRDFVRSIVDDAPGPIDVYRALDFTAPGLISEQSIARGGMPLPVPDFRSV
jgi:predicted dehydrogenase